MLKLAITLVGVASLALVATGCALLDGPTPERPERSEIIVPEEIAEFMPESSAESNLPIFLQTLEEVAQSDGALESQAVAQKFIEQGFSADLMQVSQDRTRTDLEVESMFVSARFDAECLVGQIVTADRSFVAEVLPSVGPNDDICLIGQTIPIGE